MEEAALSRFCCWQAIPTSASIYIVKAGNAREAAIKIAPSIVKDIDGWNEDSILITTVNDENKIENWYVSIQRKFTPDGE